MRKLWPQNLRLAGGLLFAVARLVSEGNLGPLVFSAHYDDHWEFTTHDLVFVSEPLVAVSEQLKLKR
jgi:hypothetical protein